MVNEQILPIAVEEYKPPSPILSAAYELQRGLQWFYKESPSETEAEIIYKLHLKLAFWEIYQGYPAVTADHSSVTALYAACLGTLLEWNSTDITKLYLAAVSHDIGKMGVYYDQKFACQFINFPGRYTGNEILTISKHAFHSHLILFDHGIRDSAILLAVCQHHENYNRTGYYKVPHEACHKFAWVLRIADSLETMASIKETRRPWQTGPPMTMEEAVKEIVQKSGQEYCPIREEVYAKFLKWHDAGADPRLITDVLAYSSMGSILVVDEIHDQTDN